MIDNVSNGILYGMPNDKWCSVGVIDDGIDVGSVNWEVSIYRLIHMNNILKFWLKYF